MIVLDAAILIEAKWHESVNEVWVASIPVKEVYFETKELTMIYC